MLPANPTQDTMGPMTRTVADAAAVLDVIAGYDPRDPLTAYAVGNIPGSYATALRADALKRARIGVLRNPSRDTTGRDSTQRDSLVGYQQVRTVIDAAIGQLKALGASVVDSVSLPRRDLAGAMGNDYETEQATDAYLRELPSAPVKTLKEILLSGQVNPWRARGMMPLVGKTTNDPGYLRVMQSREALRVSVLQLMADQRLDVIVYATFDHPPTLIAADVLTNPRPSDGYGRGDNRGLSPAIGFPALTVPAGFTPDARRWGSGWRPFTGTAARVRVRVRAGDAPSAAAGEYSGVGEAALSSVAKAGGACVL